MTDEIKTDAERLRETAMHDGMDELFEEMRNDPRVELKEGPGFRAAFRRSDGQLLICIGHPDSVGMKEILGRFAPGEIEFHDGDPGEDHLH